MTSLHLGISLTACIAIYFDNVNNDDSNNNLIMTMMIMTHGTKYWLLMFVYICMYMLYKDNIRNIWLFVRFN